MIAVEVSGLAVPRLSRTAMAAFAKAVLQAVRRLAPKTPPIADVSIALIGDRDMRALNRRFRGKRKTTDVLTFPADDSYAEPHRGRPLGDIVISVEQAKRQASWERHSLATEVRYLLLHGILHALGYDHETDRGEMNALELKLREKVGLR